MAKKPTTSKSVEALKHDEATRKNIPTAEYQSVIYRSRVSVGPTLFMPMPTSLTGEDGG